MMIRGYRIGAKLILTVIAAVALLLAILFGPAACQRIRSLTAQSKVDDAQHSALKNSAADAINTTGGVATNQAASEDTTRQNERDIRDAKGADQGVDPAVRDAGFASLCKRASFRNSPTGRVRCPASGSVAPAR